MAKGIKPEKLSFRQRLRRDAADKLDGLLEQVTESAEEVCGNTSVHAPLLMQLASQPNGGKTLRNNLITKLANDAEAELERIYNDQKDLPLEKGKSDDD